MLGVWQIFADRARHNPFTSPDFIWATAALVGVLLLGACALALAKRWKARLLEKDGPAEGRADSYRALYERGEISREEFEQISAAQARPAREGPTPPATPGHGKGPDLPPPAPPDAALP
jgi:hypothetical protein